MKKKILIGLIIILILVLGGIITYAVMHKGNSKTAMLEENHFEGNDNPEQDDSNNETEDNYLTEEAESQNTEGNQNIVQVTEEEKKQNKETNNENETKVNQTQKTNTNNSSSSKTVNSNNTSTIQKVENKVETTTNSNNNDIKSSHHEESKHVHSKVGTMGKWFASYDELVAEYNRECEKWEKLYASKKITKEEFEKNCPYRLQ